MKYLNIILASVLSICLSACSDFLNLTPRNTKVVSSVEDYRDILASFMRYMKTPGLTSQQNVMGIDIETIPFYDSDVATALAIYTGESNLSTSNSYYFDKTNNVYTQNGKNLLTWLNANSTAWNRYYKFTGPVNLIIEGITTAEGDDENLRNRVKGEALVWRAYTYYKLLQFYSPYKDNQLGIPLYLKPDQNIGTTMPERKTQAECFRQILNDCTEALNLLQKTNSNDWNFAWRTDFIHAMMADIYTWKAMSGAGETTDWSNAETHASTAMQGHTLVHTTEDLKRIFDCSDAAYLNSVESSEFYVRAVDGPNIQICDYQPAYYEGDTSDGYANKTYYQQFSDDDIRKKAWFSADGSHNDKYNLQGSYQSSGCIMPYRLADMYLIKAEALVRQGKNEEGRKVLSDFCAARYTNGKSLPSDATSLLNTIREERFKEFYMEGDAVWLDMKRFGVSMERTVSGERNNLASDDFRYCFPIPATEMSLNHKMVQNPGWENIIIY